jgi:uncharacterized glyoxalase superfamily protein PhnB
LSVDGGVISPTLTASLVHDDPREGIRWLVDVLGFRVATLYEAPDGDVAFAELVWRTGVVFVDRLHDRAVASGADIVRPVHDARTPAFPQGSHQFDVRDPGGNLWTVGTFQPRITLEGGAA